MPFFTGPQSFRQTVEQSSIANGLSIPSPDASTSLFPFPDGGAQQGGYASERGLPHLILLVFSAVLEVVCVSAPGYIVAKMGMFNAEAQKFVANLNVMLFTPCLIFTKLASQLSAGKMADLAIIPIIFVVQTFVSYLSSVVISRYFGFKKRQTNFVTAMGVFGNSNSLPISLVISLSKTLSGLHWDRVPNDNDDEVAARGILYLIIFQQLGQLLRWSWGYRVLLAPREYYLRDEEERVNVKIDHGHETYSDHPHSDDATAVGSSTGHQTPPRLSVDSSDSFLSSAHTAVHHQSPLQQPTNSEDHSPLLALPNQSYGTFMVRRNKTGGLFRFPEIEPRQGPLGPQGLKGWMRTRKECARDCLSRGQKRFSAQMGKAFSFLPRPIQRAARWGGGFSQRFLRSMWEFMNPPLWAMLIAVVVASIPSLQATFFERGTFINNSVTQAIESNAGVAVPLILVVLGANLERSTLPKETFYDHEDPKEEKKLVIASLFARMLVPTLIMGPLLALTAKFVPVSILDDPIFIIVCFLLIGAPSALQLAQICQINNVYMGAMSNLLFQSYVIWILPSTLVLVVGALKVVEWATM